MEQPADIEVLASLRHHAFVGGDDEKDEIDTACAGEHVFDESFVPGNVDKSDPDIVDLHLGESEIDRDATLFLFGKAISVDPGKSFHERGLSVIDVPGSADNYIHKNVQRDDMAIVCSVATRRVTASRILRVSKLT
jgi:hypothetical protein